MNNYTLAKNRWVLLCAFLVFSISLLPSGDVYGRETAAFTEARNLYKEALFLEFRRGDIHSALMRYSSSAQLGLPAAYTALGRIYNNPENSVYNPETAFYSYQLAADKREQFGILALAKMHIDGKVNSASRGEGVRLLKLIAERRPEAAFLLSKHLEINSEQIYYMTQAATRGHKDAINALVQIYTTGRHGVTPDAGKAQFWLNSAPSEE